jgi:hypothetical protein
VPHYFFYLALVLVLVLVPVVVMSLTPSLVLACFACKERAF